MKLGSTLPLLAELTTMATGVPVTGAGDAVGAFVGERVGLGVGVAVAIGVGVKAGVALGTGLVVCRGVGVGFAVEAGVGVCVGGVMTADGVAVGEMRVAVGVGVAGCVVSAVACAVAVGRGLTGPEPPEPVHALASVASKSMLHEASNERCSDIDTRSSMCYGRTSQSIRNPPRSMSSLFCQCKRNGSSSMLRNGMIPPKPSARTACLRFVPALRRVYLARHDKAARIVFTQ
jgi:hypothetical protein